MTGYRFERCQGVGCTVFTQFGFTITGTSYNDTGLADNTSYSYIVRAQDAAGNPGPYSNVATVTTLATNPQLVSAYSFNEGSGTTVTDLSGNGNNGTISNATWTGSGKYGSALIFNGTSAQNHDQRRGFAASYDGFHTRGVGQPYRCEQCLARCDLQGE